MIETPQMIQTTSLPTAIIPVTVSWEEMGAAMGPGIAELLTNITAQGIAPTGEIFTHHLRSPTETFDFEISVPVATPVQATGRVRPSEWPALTMARTVYHGPYEGLADAWPEFIDWIATQGHATTEELWECYSVGPRSSPDPKTWRTELSRTIVEKI